MTELTWLWIPLTIGAAFAQTLRNAAQRHLTGQLGMLGATLIRFLYGVPFVALWLGVVRYASASPLPTPDLPFVAWILVAALGQTAGTALLLRAMTERNFAIGLVYSKIEIVQVALFSVVVLGDPLSLLTCVAIALATLGVVLLSPRVPGTGKLLRPWTDKAAWFGFASGAGFAISVVGYRSASLALQAGNPFVGAAYASLWGQVIQILLLLGWLTLRNPAVFGALAREWRLSLFAGFVGALASLAMVTALTFEPAAHVRTLSLIEVLFTYAISLQVFRQAISRRELAGIVLVVLGVGLIAATS